MALVERGDALTVAVEIALCAARHAALLQVVLDARQSRHAGVVDLRSQATAVGHLHQMAEQAEARNVSHGAHARKLAEAAAGRVQGAHPVTRQTNVFGTQLGFLLGRGEDADTQWFGQVQPAASSGSVVAFHLLLVHQTGDGKAEDRFGRIDRMATSQRDACCVAHRATTGDDFAGDFRRQHVNRPTKDGDGHERVATHGIDVADGIGGGNATEIVGIVDDGHEEVGGRYHPAFLVDTVHRRIVTRSVADPQTRIEVLCATAGKNHVQHLGRYLAAAAGAVTVLGEADRFAHRALS